MPFISMRSVYLAGPIAGLTYDEAEGWRRDVTGVLHPYIDAFSPLRDKSDMFGDVVITAGCYAPTIVSDKGIVTRDHYDVQNCDAVFCNLLGAKTVSIGTMMEIAWCHAYRKPLILIMEDQGNLHDHPFVRAVAGYRTASILHGVALTKTLLLSRPGGVAVRAVTLAGEGGGGIAKLGSAQS
jgi:nucleoside 2-deoxyribosyltransferase